jgi:hypothetical protein
MADDIPQLFIPPMAPAERARRDEPRPVPQLFGELPAQTLTQIPSTQGVGEDIARGVAAKGTLGLAADLPGLPGTVWNLATRALPEAVGRGAVGVGESLGLISPAAEERGKESVSQFFKEKIDQPIAEARSRAGGFGGMSTIPQMEQRVKEAAPFTQYEPQTYPGQVLGEAARFGAQGLVGGVAGLPGRLGIGMAAGAGSEMLGQEGRQAGPMNEAIGRFIGAIGGGLGFAGASKIARDFAPGYFGKTEARVFDTLAEEMQSGTASMTPDQLRLAVEQGLRITPFEVGGPKTRALLNQYAARTPESLRTADLFNRRIQDVNNQVHARFQQFADDVAGFPVDAASYAKAVRNQDASEIAQLYRVAQSNPMAVNIPTNDLWQVWSSPSFQMAAKKAADTAADVPSWGIRVPTQGVNGNLPFYDQVKKELDVIGGMAKRSGDTTMLARVTDINNRLKSYLDQRIPEYTAARDKASESFGARNAVEAGYNFLNTSQKTGRTMMDEMSRREIATAFNSYSPQQQAQFRAMNVGRIANIASEPGGVQRLYKMFNENPHFESNMRVVMGDDLYQVTKGRVIAETVQSEVARAAEMARLYSRVAPGGTDRSLTSATAAAVPVALMEMSMMGGMPTGITAGAATAGYLTSKVNSIYGNAAERAMAKNIIPMLTSTEPAIQRRLAEIASTGAGRDVLGKMTTFLQNQSIQAEKLLSDKLAEEESQFQEQRLTRQSGGRTVRNVAESLMDQIDRARKEFQKETNGLLQHDDEHIVKALKIANERS